MSSRSKHCLAEVCERAKLDPGLPSEKPTISYWQCPESETVATSQSHQLPAETDVIVIGSGISGCSIARHLLEGDERIRVTILEARKITSGATGRNGGHIKAVPEHSYAELLPVLGSERAKEVVRFTLANVEALFKLSSTLSPELQRYSEVRHVNSLNLFTSQTSFSEFQLWLKEFESANAKRGRIVTSEELQKDYGIHNAVGGYTAPAGAGWPYRLITGIFADLLHHFRDRFTLEALTPAISVEYQQDGHFQYCVQTPRGSIRAKHVVHATNAHAGHLLSRLRGIIYPVRGQMTAQAPSNSFGIQGGKQSWAIHYGSGFDYMTQSGQTGEIFLGGGLAQAEQRGLEEVGNVRDDQNSVLATAHLSGIVDSVWPADPAEPATSHVIAKWTGIMGFTADGLPLVGRIPQEGTGRDGAGEWISAGFNGYGMANAWLCGKHIASSILGKPDDGVLPRSYVVTTERLGSLSCETAIKAWMAEMGID